MAADPPHRLELVDAFADDSGAKNESMPSTGMTMTLTEREGGGTTMTLHSQFASLEAMEQLVAMGMDDGIVEALGQIEGILADDAARTWGAGCDESARLASSYLRTNPIGGLVSFHPYLFFVGTCREAMTAYQDIFGGQLDIVTAAEMPDAPPDAPKDAIMHAALTLPNGGMLMASDDPSATEDAPKVGISVSYTAADPDEAARVFKGLSEGGEVQLPLGETSWSPAFGMCIDRFGIPLDGGHQPHGVAPIAPAIGPSAREASREGLSPTTSSCQR